MKKIRNKSRIKKLEELKQRAVDKISEVAEREEEKEMNALEKEVSRLEETEDLDEMEKRGRNIFKKIECLRDRNITLGKKIETVGEDYTKALSILSDLLTARTLSQKEKTIAELSKRRDVSFEKAKQMIEAW